MKNAPIILIIGLIILTGGITYGVFNRLNQLGSNSPLLKFGIKPSDLPGGKITPTPKKNSGDTAFQLDTTPTPPISKDAKNAFPTGTSNDNQDKNDSADSNTADASLVKTKSQTTKTTTTRICTPVYGMADTCVEHITVDTGADTAALFNLGALSYLGGLLAFIKAKLS